MAMTNFDPSFFRDPVSGKFRFPAYTVNWNGLVQIRDNTHYKKQLFGKLSAAKIDNFTLKEFEAARIEFSIEVESFEDFLKRFPPECFNKGVSKNDLDLFFCLFDCDWAKPEEEDNCDFSSFNDAVVQRGINAGLLTVGNTTGKEEEYWNGWSTEELAILALKHNIIPASTQKKLIEQLVHNKVPYTETQVKPSNILRKLYRDLVHFYLHDIKKNTLHFHPRILNEVWNRLARVNYYSYIEYLVKPMLKKPYWLSADGIDLPSDMDPALISNNAFTFFPPGAVTDPKFTRPQRDPNQESVKGTYRKARAGSFDESYFSKAGSFCFPDYTDNPDALVFIDDQTRYKKTYLAPRSRELKDFTIDELERNFVEPDLEVRYFPEFLEDLPAGYFPQGITGKRLSEFMDEFLTERLENEDDFSPASVLMSASDPLVINGYFEKSDQSLFHPAQTWISFPIASLVSTCKENGIKPGRGRFNTIWNLINSDVPLPLEWYHPTSKFFELYKSLINVYLDDLVKNTNHFHPLYIESVWKYLDSPNPVLVEDRAREYLSRPYWEDRLIEIEK